MMKNFFKKISSNIEKIEENSVENKNGTIKVINGILSVKDPIESGMPACLIPNDKIKIIVDGEEINSKQEVFEKNNIEVILNHSPAKRELNISINENKMLAYVTIKYLPEEIYKLKDIEEKESTTLETELIKEVFPPLFKSEEIKEELKKLGIVYGIIEENLKKCSNELEIFKMEIAKGKEPVDGQDDRIEYFFNIDTDITKFKEDSNGKIDFRNIGAIEVVKKDDIIAKRIFGEKGTDGVDIKGNLVKHKNKKEINLKVSHGCKLHDNSVVISTIDGKPCIKGSTFFVYETHEVMEDVDLKTGNIKFAGDIVIRGDVKEGMKVEAGNSVNILKNVECAEIKGRGDVTINGNVINSKVIAGGEDVDKLSQIEILTNMKNQFSEFISTIEEIKRFNLLGYDATDGQIIKVLLESKFKIVNQLAVNYIKEASKEGNLESLSKDEIIFFIRTKLIGLAPFNIKHYSELVDFKNKIIGKLEALTAALNIPVNIKISYCQDSIIKSSGDIFIVGKGVYISNIEAQKSIYFTENHSVLRGGIIKAQEQIRCKTVGSLGGVSTKLIVSDGGRIFAEIAYANTVFVIGTREICLENPSKNIQVYLNDEGEIIIEKLKL